MYVTITADNSDETLYQRKLKDEEILDLDAFANWFASVYYDADISYDGAVPLGCGDFSVEFADNPKNGVCWSSKSYFMKAA